MKQEQLITEMCHDYRKQHKAVYQAWNKNAISLQYVGLEATARITVADYSGITLQYSGTGAGVVEVTENSLILTANSVPTTYDLTAAAYDTIAELVAVIDALTYWACTKHANMNGAELSKNLAIVTVADAKTDPVTLAMDRCIYAEAPNSTPDTNWGIVGKLFLRGTAVDTLAELVAFIDGLADWTCALGDQFDGTEASSSLATAVAADAKTAALVLLQGTNLQIKIVIPVTATGKKVTVTKVLGSITGTGAGTFEFTKGSTVVWTESAGLTTVEKVSTLPSLDSDVGEQLTLKVKMATTLTAGYLAVAYDEKYADATEIRV
jgi:hypothetical protein